MPTYEYACTSCAHEWEFEQSIREDPAKQCPECRKNTAQRQISRGGGFILKGGGWYSDLYASSSNKKSEAKPDSPSATTSTESSAKTETKTETKTEAKSETKTETTSKKGDVAAA